MKRPLGPWATSSNNYSDAYQLQGPNHYSVEGYGSWSFPCMMGWERTQRSGFNSGPPPYVHPTPSSLDEEKWWWERNWNISFIDHSGGEATLYTHVSGPSNYAITHYASTSESDYNDLLNGAVQKLYRKVNGRISDGAVFTGEIKETIGMLKHGAELIFSKTNNVSQSLGRVYKNLRNGFHSHALKELSDTFLEYRFGVQPLISDISSAIDSAPFVKSGGVARPIRSSLQATKYIDIQLEHSNSNYDAVGLVRIESNSTSFGRRIVKVGCVLDLSLMSEEQLEYYSSALAVLGLTWNRVAPTTWELLPLSWLADYYSNLGQIIDSLSYLRTGVVDGWLVSIEKSELFNELIPVADSYWSSDVAMTSGFVRSEKILYNRTPFDVASFIPSLEVRVPDGNQAMNVIALMVQRLTKMRIKETKFLQFNIPVESRKALLNLAKTRIFK